MVRATPASSVPREEGRSPPGRRRLASPGRGRAQEDQLVAPYGQTSARRGVQPPNWRADRSRLGLRAACRLTGDGERRGPDDWPAVYVASGVPLSRSSAHKYYLVLSADEVGGRLATVAQLAEQRFCKPQVMGSSPFGGFLAGRRAVSRGVAYLRMAQRVMRPARHRRRARDNARCRAWLLPFALQLPGLLPGVCRRVLGGWGTIGPRCSRALPHRRTARHSR